jgi:hypothetical protein
MLKSILFVAAIALMISTCRADTDTDTYYYWLDASCSESKRPGWNTYKNEAFEMARRTSYRLQTKDKDMRTAFRRIFQTDPANTDNTISRTETFKQYNKDKPGADTAYNIVQRKLSLPSSQPYRHLPA